MRRIAWAVAPAAILVAFSAWEIWATVRGGSDVGKVADWAAAADVVRSAYRPGDLIAFAPSWVDPVGRAHLGDLIPVAVAARMDAARYERVWELSVRGGQIREARGAKQVLRRAFGPVTVRLLERDPVRVVFDFVDAFGDAAVSGSFATRSRDRNVPPAVDIEEVGFAPRRCVRVVPRANRTVRVAYRNVPLGSSLVGYVGLADVFTRRDRRQPGRLVVEVDGHAVARADFGVDDGWVRFAAQTRSGREATVVFAATAIGAQAHDRLVCFAAEARR